MKKIIYIFLLISIYSKANTPLFNQANEMYSKGEYQQAIDLYKEILSKDLVSAELYYNLGNSYYKIDDLANSIFYFHKSLKIKKDKKTLKNLKIVQSKTIDRIEPLPTIFYHKWWNQLINLFTTKIWQLISIISIWAYSILLLLKTYKKIKILSLSLPIFLSSILLFIISFYSFEKDTNKEAIIFSSAVQVTNEPDENSNNKFSIHLGTKIEIINNDKDWVEIKISNGQNGWIKNNHFKILN